MNPNVILTPDALEEAVAYFTDYDAFSFDVESVGEHRSVPTRNEVTWLAMSTHGKGIVIPFGHPNGDRLLRRAHRKKNRTTGKMDLFPPIYDDPPEQLRPSQVFKALRPLFFSDRIKVAHNATFDLISVTKYFAGEIPPGPYHDTIVMQWLLNENLRNKGLKNRIESRFGVAYDHENVGKRVELHPFSKVAHYAYMDARYTWLLWKDLHEQIDAADLWDVFDLEERVLAVLLDMGTEGAPVDVERMETLKVELSERLVGIQGDIYRAAGRKFNINSRPQMAEVLFAPKDDGGQGLKAKVLTAGGYKKAERGEELAWKDYSTSADTLEQWPKNKVVKPLLDYAEVHKILNTYIIGYLGDDKAKDKPCRIFDKRIHADFVQYGTVTGRFSCREPNLQNIPRPDNELGKKIRGLFIAPPGWKLVVADYGQIELVILAHFAGKGALWEGFHAGIDPHTMTAAGVFKRDPKELTALVKDNDADAKRLRQIAKNLNFAIVYGAGPDKVASMSGVRVKEAKGFMDLHQKAFPEIYKFKAAVIETCKARRPPHIRTMSGRKRRLPQIWSRDRKVSGSAERQAVNSLIQGSAADLIKMAMVRLHPNLTPDMRLILSVHDELVTLAKEDVAPQCADLVTEAMLGEEMQRLLTVPLSSDVKIVDRWSDAK